MEEFEDRPIRSEFMPLSIARALWKRKLLILASWVLICAAGAVVVYQLPAIYEAQAIILIERQRIPERFVSSTVNEDLTNRLNRIEQEIKSYDQLLGLIEEFKLYAESRDSRFQEELVRKMRDSIQVRPVDGMVRTNAPAFQISFEGRRPALVAQVTNRLADMFIRANLQTRATQALGTSEFLADQLAQAKREVERQEELLRDFRLRHSGELPEQENALMSEMRRLQLELESAEAAVDRAHQNKTMVDNALDSARVSLETLEDLAAEEARAVAGIRGGSAGRVSIDTPAARLREAEAVLAALTSRYSADHPDVLRQKQQVAELRALAEGSAGEEAIDSPRDLDNVLAQSRLGQQVLRERERVDSLQVQADLAAQQIAAEEERRRQLSRRLSGMNAKLSRLPILEQELQKISRDYDISRENYEQLLGMRNEADLSAEMETMQKAEKFSVLEAARRPERPVRPNRRLLLAANAAAGLALSCFIGFGMELRKNVLLGEWELPPDALLLGQIPYMEASEEGLDPSPEGTSRPGFRLAVIASSVVLSLALFVATSLYFGWISF